MLVSTCQTNMSILLHVHAYASTAYINCYCSLVGRSENASRAAAAALPAADLPDDADGAEGLERSDRRGSCLPRRSVA